MSIVVVVPVLAAEAGWEAHRVAILAAWVLVDEVQASGFVCMSRPVAVHNGCTFFHLPWVAPRNDVAKPAILAARMARSSLETRRLLI